MTLSEPPRVPDEDDLFWDGVKAGRLLLAKCARCARLQHPPSPMCPHCGSLEWDAHEASGRGKVHSWIVSHHPSEPDESPRIVVLVALEEGVRLVSNLQHVRVEDVTNDMAVGVMFTTIDGVKLPQFRPVGPAA